MCVSAIFCIQLNRWNQKGTNNGWAPHDSDPLLTSIWIGETSGIHSLSINWLYSLIHPFREKVSLFMTVNGATPLYIYYTGTKIWFQSECFLSVCLDNHSLYSVFVFILKISLKCKYYVLEDNHLQHRLMEQKSQATSINNFISLTNKTEKYFFNNFKKHHQQTLQ